MLSGLRIGEALGLTSADASIKNASVTVLRSVGEVNGIVVVGPSKTKGSRRRVDLADLAGDALRRRLSYAGKKSEAGLAKVRAHRRVSQSNRADIYSEDAFSRKVRSRTINSLARRKIEGDEPINP